MQLIKKLDYRKNKTGIHGHTWGLFLCSICNKEVEKDICGGKKAMSCGCSQGYFISKSKFKHGEIKTRLYTTWAAMKERCLNSDVWYYKNYGGRGIKICDEWLDKKDGYINFRDWAMNNGYRDDLQIDRIENNGDYEPNNCRFVTHAINCQNRRTTKLNLGLANEIRSKYSQKDGHTVVRLAREYNTDHGTISSIIRNQLWKET